MDVTALFSLSYGLYIIGAKDGEKVSERNVGCVVNAVAQSTANPVTLTVCINKDNYTNACIKRTKTFAVSILSERVKESVFGIFGFSSSRDRDKFAEVPFGFTPSGLPYVIEGVTGYLQCKVIGYLDNFTHTVFIAEVQEAENLSKEPPMTYAYYHKVIKGKTPRNASSYVEESLRAHEPEGSYVCGVCGYEYLGSKEEFERISGDYTCPICGAPKSKFISQPIQPNTGSIDNKVSMGGTKMASLKGTKTEKNLMEAFAGESQARNKYTYFAGKAKKEGFEQIAEIFEETAGNEKEHAKIWFKLLCGGDIPTTADNLKAAAAGENGEWTNMYKRMAAEAREEGFNDIAFLFESVGAIEKEHEERYLKLLKNVEDGTVFAKKEKSVWICRNCGHIVDYVSAPVKCPVCAHPQAYFELRVINY